MYNYNVYNLKIMYMSVYTCITANYWCCSEECSMVSIVRTIIPDLSKHKY